MTKITKFDVKEPFKGQNSAFVAFDDKEWGFYEYDGKPKFKVGDDVEYTITKEKSESGKDVKKLTIKHTEATHGEPPQRPAINVGVGKSKEEMKANLTIGVLVKLIELLHNGKLETAQIATELKEWDLLGWSEIDDAYKG